MTRTIPLKTVEPEEFPAFNKHVCPPTFGGGPIDPVTANVRLARNLLVNLDLVLPDGKKVPLWILEDPEDPAGGKVFPSKTIRTVQGDIIHARVGGKTNTHTIHWHGIEPTPMNDGVGKNSFEISGNFTYQIATNEAGTYFYHCHKNTTLHFEMGLYGLFIVDPKKRDTPEAAGIQGPPYRTGGPGFAAAFNPPTHVRKYDVEAFWVPDEIDSKWHTLGHNAFMQICDLSNPVAAENFTRDGFLHDFNPDIFLITGKGRHGTGDTATFEEVEINAKVGETILIRVLNAGYTIQEYRIGLPAEVIAMDGHPLGVPPRHQYSHPFKLAAGEPFRLTSAMRTDLLIRASEAGKFPAEIDYIHWITGKKLFTARTFINVGST